MTEVVFLPEAAEDIERLFQFLMRNATATAARKAMRAIDGGVERLIRHPNCGAPMVGREAYRQLFILFGSSAYVLRYRFDEDRDRLVIVRVWHGKDARA